MNLSALDLILSNCHCEVFTSIYFFLFVPCAIQFGALLLLQFTTRNTFLPLPSATISLYAFLFAGISCMARQTTPISPGATLTRTLIFGRCSSAREAGKCQAWVPNTATTGTLLFFSSNVAIFAFIFRYIPVTPEAFT